MAPKILFLYHVDYENGGIFLDRARLRGDVTEKYLSNEKIREDDHKADLLVIMGGPMNVDDTDKHHFLKDELRLIAEFAKNKKPVLGICLGAQLIAKALGGRVTKNHVKEIGWYGISLTPHGDNDPLIAPLQQLKKVFQWHGDMFSPPQGARHLIQSPLCAYQAFVYQQTIYALQFHLEVTEAMIAAWLEEAGNVQELKTVSSVSPKAILRDTKEHIAALNRVGTEFFDAYLDLVLHG
jgi:GMP synthase (glutamine-hydrolysing)